MARIPFTQLPLDATGPLSAANSAIAVSALGMGTAVFGVPAGSWNGTLVAEGTLIGDYSDAIGLNVIPYGGGASQSITAGGIYEIGLTGLSGVRLRASGTVSGGPITVMVRAAPGNKSIRVGAPAANPVAVARAPLTYAAVTGSPFTLTSSWQKVVTTTSATKGLRIAPLATATAADIEWVAVAAGAQAPTDAYGEPIQGGEDFAAGLPIGDVYLKSASGQVAIVRVGA